MNKKLLHTLNYIFFLSVGIGLLYLAFRNQNLKEIFEAVKSVHLWWTVPVFIAWILGLIARALRWKLIIEPLGYKPSFANLFNTMMLGYLVNYAVPRLGEITRCMSLKKKENIPPVVLFGTVTIERVTDVIMLFVLVGATLVLEYDKLSLFFSNSVFGPLSVWANEKIFSNTKLLIGIAVLVGAGIYYLLKWSKKPQSTEINDAEKPATDKLDDLVNEVWVGLSAVNKIERYGLYIFYSVFIWISYYLTSYLWFKAFDATADLAASTAFVVMMMGALGRALPIQGGGMGAYHYMVCQSLLLFGVGETLGYAYAIVNHGSSSVFYIVIGAISWLILLFTKDKSESYI